MSMQPTKPQRGWTGGHGKPPTLPYLRSVHSSNWSSQPKRRRACRLSKTVSEISILTNGSTRSEEHTSELQSLMRISYAVFCLKKKTNHTNITHNTINNDHKNIHTHTHTTKTRNYE